MEQLTGIDASFIYLETARAPMHIGGVVFYKAPPQGFHFQDYVELVRSRLHLSKVYRRRLVQVPFGLDAPYWIEDPNFNLDSHIHHLALPRPGGWEQLRELAQHLLAIPLDLRRPLWSLAFVEGLDGIDALPKGSFAMIHKIHHAAVDGMAGVDLLTTLVDLTPEVQKYPGGEHWLPDMEPSNVKLLGNAYIHLLAKPKQAVKLAGALTKSAWNVGKDVLVEKQPLPAVPFRGPRTRFNVPISAERRCGGVWLRLDEIKAVKNDVANATVNDVVLATCAGGIRRYLLSKGELPEKELTAMAPISVRSSSSEGGNQVSAMLVPLATDEADSLKRLKAICRSTRHSKERMDAVGATALMDAAKVVPFSLGTVAARLYSRMEVARYVRPFFNTVITNVPGPRQKLYFGGGEFIGSMGMAPIMDGMGLMLVVTSYGDYLTISVTSTPEILPDIAFFEECLTSSFKELRGNVKKPGSKKGSGKRSENVTGPTVARPAAAKAGKSKLKGRGKLKKGAARSAGSEQSS
jgi:WS/DGAT/MGAT family acyltransferase